MSSRLSKTSRARVHQLRSSGEPAVVATPAGSKPTGSTQADSTKPQWPDALSSPDPDDLDGIVAWLARLQLLEGVPFNYLVADPGLLPVESIRFFQLDVNWVNALIDGAFSVGSYTASDQASDARLRPAVLERVARSRRQLRLRRLGLDASEGEGKADPGAAITGFMLRSAVVSGWPNLEVSGYADTARSEPLSLLRMERLAPTLLLVLFEGSVSLVDIQEPAEGIHFGTEIPPNVLNKTLRYLSSGDGHDVGETIPDSNIDVPVRDQQRQVIKVQELAQNLPGAIAKAGGTEPKAFTAAEFALEMVQGVERVSFTIDTFESKK